MHNVLGDDIVVLSAARTPIGRFAGQLSAFDAVELGSLAIGAAVSRAGIGPDAVDTVNMGIVVSAGLGLAPAKAAAVGAGIPPTAHARAVETVCGSAMDAIGWALESLSVGTAQVAVAGGMESRTSAPYLVGPTFRRNSQHYHRGDRISVTRAGAYRFQFDDCAEEQLRCTGLVDATTYDGLFWREERKFMRQHALAFAARQGYTAEVINRCAAESHRKARRATEQGLFDDEIVAAGSVEKDELVPEERLERELAENPEDLASAYNSSTPADAAACLVLTTARRAKELGARPVARVLGYARVDGPAADYLSAPVRAAEKLIGELRAAGRPAEFTVVEANEAFGIQIPLFEQTFTEMDINVHGGAVALGHPLGAAGARLLTTLLYAMQRYGHRLGLVTICYGGGGGYAAAVERLG